MQLGAYTIWGKGLTIGKSLADGDLDGGYDGVEAADLAATFGTSNDDMVLPDLAAHMRSVDIWQSA